MAPTAAPVCNANLLITPANPTNQWPPRVTLREGKKEKARSYHLPAVSTALTRWKPGEGTALSPGCVQRSIPAPSVSCLAKGCPRSSPTDVGLFNILSPVVHIGLVGEERHLCLLEFGSHFFLCETQQSQRGCRCRNHSPVTAPCSYSMHF